MNREARKRMGVKDTPVEVVADSIEREFKNMPHFRIIGSRPAAEALAFIAIRRLRRFDREVLFRVGRRLISKVDAPGVVKKGERGVIRMTSKTRVIIKWENGNQDVVDKNVFKKLCAPA